MSLSSRLRVYPEQDASLDPERSIKDKNQRVVMDPGIIKVEVAGSKSIKTSHSRQVVALTRKALAYQKRQNFTNICCISLCPLLMVALSAILGNLILSLVQKSSPSSEYLFCSNADSMNSINLPYWKSGDDNITQTDGRLTPGTTADSIYNSNWALVLFLSNDGPPGAELSTFKRPCVFWFGEDYPYSQLYERNPNASGKAVRDSTYLSQPLNGWFAALALGNQELVTDRSINVFNGYQQRSWSIVSADPSVNLSMIGEKARAPVLSIPDYIKLPTNPSFASTKLNQAGLLATIPTRYYLSISGISQAGVSAAELQPVPWYNYTGGSGDDLDNLISTALLTAIAKIASFDKRGIDSSGNLTSYNSVFIRAAKLLEDLPHGGLYFKTIDHINKRYAWNYHYGTDKRLTSSSNFPATGRRLLLQQTQLDNAILRNSDPSRFGDAQITQGLRILPQVGSTAIILPFGGIIGAILYPFGISFLLPIFAIILVQEKENRILVMMKMNGMKSWAYYASHYVTFLILYVISATIFLVSGGLAKLTMFTGTGKSLLAILFFLWGNNQIGLAFFFSTMFNKSRFALVLVFLIVLCSVIISIVIDRLFVNGAAAPSIYFIWPPFAFYRALGLINRASYTNNAQAYSLDNLQKTSELFTIMVFLLCEIPVYLLTSYYFESVLPTEFGVRKPWHFPITSIVSWYQRLRVRKANGGVDVNTEMVIATSIQIDEAETCYEDSDVKAERARVLHPDFDYRGYPLVMKSMRKMYAGRGGARPKLAVKDVTFAVEKGVTFGLLGPNGAGKTTLISILTGLYETSSGVAILAGFDIQKETEEVYRRIGICPQFDILWDELTVGEHLYFYARLKGVESCDENRAVSEALTNVSLTSFENRLTRGLSGGERRRLSIAIALLGNPSVVFLDEPTTGLDPEVRRLIWNIINEARVDKTIILTTHSMEEAEALCQRIGIMAKGTLRCLANPTRLKELYGPGFRIFANSLEVDTLRVSVYLESLLPIGWKRIDSFATNTSYEFPPVKGILSMLFQEIEAQKVKHGILDWGIGQTTLEEVFVRLISEDDASAES